MFQIKNRTVRYLVQFHKPSNQRIVNSKKNSFLVLHLTDENEA